MTTFALASMLAYTATVAHGVARRTRFYVIFVGVVLGFHTLSSTALFPAVSSAGHWAAALFWYGQVATFIYFSRVARARGPRPVYRVLVSWPASMFAAAVFLAIPWAIVAGLGLTPRALWVPFALAGFGLLQSLWTRHERLRIVLDGEPHGDLSRAPTQPRRVRFAATPPADALRVVQITDPHLGPFMSVARLRGICERAVQSDPHLVLLTGDFLTVESQWSSAPLSEALAPLAALPGRVFACMGNHDHECPRLVKEALSSAGVELLIDRAVEVETRAGPVQIVGADHHFQERGEALARVAARYPRTPGALRLWLLHDPGAFHHIPEGEADLVLSGHTHGGHLGLLSLGLSHTVVSAATRMPDHGLWARGRDRLYVHRGTGHYGFPLRIGVPAEESVLEIVRAVPAPP